ncbi:MAG: malto-oligosyltrehalose trehalohydrolase [Gemmatimonas sp.]
MTPRQQTIEPSTLRRCPVGVEIVHEADGSAPVHARVWAPGRQAVELINDDDSTGTSDSPLTAEGNGYFSGYTANAAAGTRYRFRLDRGDAFPDPASRFQPEGPHGPSMIVDPAAYQWSDHDWPGVSIDGQVIYELHIGTFTSAGTFRGAMERLPDLVDTGVTVLEIMPIADFAGRFGWGYDGVNLFAPSRLYGTPDDLRALVDAAHRLRLGVILDVVYNHFGPDGNYLAQFSPHYVSDMATEWGNALNFDGEHSAPVREFIVANARYWIDEFHLDGLRLDATQQVYDSSTPHILAEIGDAVRRAARGRETIVLGENEPQRASLVRPLHEGGCALDALWNDDFHHAARVAATGRAEAYYSGFRGTAQEFISAAKYGFLYQGEWYAWQHQRRGQPALDLPPSKFVLFTQNHDQIANSHGGRRLHQETSPGRHRALTALLLLLPQTPMLFQGQEFAASSPFLYFADHDTDLAKLVRDGRRSFMSQFPSVASSHGSVPAHDPADGRTFARCKLDWSERHTHTEALHLHRDLLRIRREDPVIRSRAPRGLDGAVLTDFAFVLRFFGDDGDDRLLVVNLGARYHADPLAEPLVAPPYRRAWTTVFSTESPKYGGWGSPPIETIDDGWWLPPECAVLLAPTNAETSGR